MKAIRWSRNDHYFGPFTYARENRSYRPIAVMFGTGDGDEYPHARLRLSAFGHTLICRMPAILKPWRKWVDTSHYAWSRGERSGYWETHEREWGFSAVEGSLHLHFGPQTHDSTTTKSKCWFYPWREHRMVRHSLYDLEGVKFCDLPECRLSNKYSWEASKALREDCPVALFEFADFDGERIVATCQIQEREYRRGKGVFRLLYLWRNPIYRTLELNFSSEVGRRKGSWKGGTVGHSCTINVGEHVQEAFERYCAKEGLKFIGEMSKC